MAVLLFARAAGAQQMTAPDAVFGANRPSYVQPMSATAPLGAPDQIGGHSLVEFAPPPPAQPAFTENPQPQTGWTWQVLPDGLLYKSYLAGPKEPRLGQQFVSEKNLGGFWDATLGGRVGLLRYGSQTGINPRGFQIDLAGMVMTRLDPSEQSDLEAADFRIDVPFTWRINCWQVKFGYYHISSHIGDERMERLGLTTRDNYVREAVNFGIGYFATPDLRFYAELGAAISTSGAADPLELQLGFDYSPMEPRGIRGAPYAAANFYFREEERWNSGITVSAGWQWRGKTNDHVFRIGLMYYTGKTMQFAFARQPNMYEQLVGFGMWYDF